MSDIPMMNGEGLLECPFCDSSSAFVSVASDYDFSVAPKYQAICGCGVSTEFYSKRESVIKAWNTRKGHLWTVDDFKQMNAERNI